MITVNLIHYNRPYMLDLNVNLLRHFLGDSIRIVVADDGSAPEIVKKIKTFAIDDIYAHKRHWNKKGTVRGSFSKTVRKSVHLCKTDLYMFCEDDFIYLKSPIHPLTVGHVPALGSLLPEVPVNTDKECIFSVAEQLLNRSHVGLVKLQAHNRICNRSIRKGGVPEMLGDLQFWACEPRSGLCNSWPYVIRKELADQIQVPKTDAYNVWRRQNYIKSQLMTRLGSQRVMLANPGRVVHVGNGVSVNVTETDSDHARRARSYNLQKTVGRKQSEAAVFAADLGSKFCEGLFYFDLNEVLESGVNNAFQSAYDRVRC